jgi:hypothetical protein
MGAIRNQFGWNIRDFPPDGSETSVSIKDRHFSQPGNDQLVKNDLTSLISLIMIMVIIIIQVNSVQ